MMTTIINSLSQAVIHFIYSAGYAGVFLLMILESCGIPAPSEVIMPFAGFLVATAKFNFWIVVLMGTLGNLVGSSLAYYIGWKGGRPLIEKYGKFMLISKHDLRKADKWFAKYGETAVLIGRFLPVVRTYISFPAGVSEMKFRKFISYTFLGTFPWSILFTYLGIKLSDNWESIQTNMHNFYTTIIVGLVFIIGLYIWRHIRKTPLK